jgi:protein-disulfide isomerase
MKRLLPFAIIVIVLGGAFAGGWYWWHAAQKSVVVSKASTGAGAPAVVTSSPVPGAEPPHVRGADNAPVTLEEFGDFECPPCGAFYPTLKTMEGEYGARLRVIFREFPLAQMHPHALAAAHAAEAAGLQGKFWEMHDLLYENQKTWHEAFDVRPIFDGYAKQIGLDMNRYQKDLNSDPVAQRIFLDGKRAHSMGVKGTPTVFLNGKEVPFESLPSEKLRPLINQEIANHK